MSDPQLKEIKIERVSMREGGNGEAGNFTRECFVSRTPKLREVGDLDDTGEKTVGTPTSGTVGEQRSKGDVVLGRELADSPRKDEQSTQEDIRAEFYTAYSEVAEEYDKEFIKRHNGNLNTILISAGLFTVVTLAFIIEFRSQLRPDPKKETVALLRVALHNIDNTTFGGNAPALPQWTDPPWIVPQVQCLLYASLATSLFSAFLAMLGKLWLIQYASVDPRWTVIERSQNRQLKLDAIVRWHFEHVVESLPLMLQVALLLLGCALFRYLRETNAVIAFFKELLNVGRA